MDGRIATRLQALGITLPALQPPVASYVPYVITGNLVVISGQLPMITGKLAWSGKLGGTVSPADGTAAARQCFLNVLAHLNAACDGDLDRVACTPDFTQHATIMNGASELAVEIFGDAGRHARSTIGVPSLPFDAPVEVEGIFEID
jgi:enamine deaminase RidA (YjgF/YER057c/UK114 family)